MSRVVIYQKKRKARRTQVDLLGTDLKFPLQTSPSGDLQTISGVPNVEQAMIDILENLQGEVIFHEEMGGELIRNVSRACTQMNADKLAFLAHEQIMQFEARVKTLTVNGSAEPADDASNGNDSILLDITYTTIYYHHEQNMTYDFVLGGVNGNN